MPIPINIEQMNSLIDQTYNQKSGTANSITPVIEGNFLKDFLAFQNSYFVGKSDTIAPEKGGTGIAGGYAAGDIIIATAANVLGRLPKGSDGQVLTLVAGLPAWSAASGGGGALSDITAATAAHTINNAANVQEWQWNAISSGIGFKITTSSAAATSNTQVLFELRKTGITSGSSSGSVLLNVINEDTNPTSTTKAAHFEGRGFAVTFGKTGVNAGYGDVAIFGNSKLHFYHNGALSAFIDRPFNVNSLRINAPSNGGVNVVTGSDRAIFFDKTFGDAFMGFGYTSTTKQTHVFGGDNLSGGYRAASTHAAVVENESGVLKLSANTGLAGGFAGFTPVWQLVLHAANNNVGIGTTTPNSSAKLDVWSTTSGFAPPEMIATQASAISTNTRKLIIYVTSTNGTFTSAGLWLWTGSTWKLILAE